MPNKDPSFWAILFAFYHQHTNAINSFVMAFFVAVFRICYIGKERKFTRMLFEAVLCGLIAVASESVLEYLQLPTKLAVAIGAVVALFGIDKVRELALRYSLKRR